MIVLDTNVLSEPLRAGPDPRVLSWLSEHSRDVAITAITVAELRFGVLRLPGGRRRDELMNAVDALLRDAADRTFSFDASAAEIAGRLRAEREASGRAVSTEDTMIAAICLAGGHSLATRNTRDFADAGIELHDPWSA